MPESIEFLVVRHAQTEADSIYRSDDYGIFVPHTKKRVLKGSFDNSFLYRLSDEGILYAHETALALLKHYKGGKRVMLFHSPLIRTTEFEEILRQVLEDASHSVIDEFKERRFGSLEGHSINELERAVIETKQFPNYGQALAYADDFSFLEEHLGLEIKKGELFKDALKRVYKGVQQVVERCFTADHVPLFDYVPIVGHQISGIYLIHLLRLIGKPPEEVDKILESIKTQDDKDREMPYFHLEPARFYMVRFIPYGGRLWTEVQEHNDWHHLALLESRITNSETGETRIEGEEAQRVTRVRKLLTRWYAKRSLPLNPDMTTTPFYMHAGDGTEGLQINSPLELSDIIAEHKKIPDSFIQYHMGTRENIDQIPNWVENVFGYNELAEIMRKRNTTLIGEGANLSWIRIEIQKTMHKYMHPE